MPLQQKQKNSITALPNFPENGFPNMSCLKSLIPLTFPHFSFFTEQLFIQFLQIYSHFSSQAFPLVNLLHGYSYLVSFSDIPN